MIEAGKLDQRVKLQQKSVTRDNGIGEEVVAWVDVVTDTADHCVWAEVVPVRGREFFAAAQMQQTVDVRFRIRTRAGLVGTMRLVWKSENYDIIAIIPGTAQYAGTIELMAVKGVRDGR